MAIKKALVWCPGHETLEEWTMRDDYATYTRIDFNGNWTEGLFPCPYLSLEEVIKKDRLIVLYKLEE